jgi:hypothetical protein
LHIISKPRQDKKFKIQISTLLFLTIKPHGFGYNTRMKKVSVYIVSLLLLCMMGFAAFKVYDNTRSCQEMTRIIVDKQQIEQLSKNRLKRLAELLSLGLYEGYSELVAQQQKLQDAQLFFRRQAQRYTACFAVVLGAILLMYFAMTRREFVVILSLSALIALVSGLVTPVMTMSIHKEVEHLGDIVFTMESKGVLDTIMKLFETNDHVVGGTLLLFSIVLPLSKTFSLLFLAIFVDNRWAHKAVHLLQVLGKWSMADVFVVATFLVYLSSGKGDMSRAEIQMGLYLFLAYVILSMLASLSAEQMTKEQLAKDQNSQPFYPSASSG